MTGMAELVGGRNLTWNLAGRIPYLTVPSLPLEKDTRDGRQVMTNLAAEGGDAETRRQGCTSSLGVRSSPDLR